LDDESLAIVLQSLHTLTERRLDKDTRLALDEEDRFPTELVEEMFGPELGLHLLFLPEEVGGLGGGCRDLFRVSEEMARVDLGVASALLATALGVDPIIVGGTEEQRQRWLGRIAEEGLIVAYGVTEPEAGSDVARLKTVADPIESDGSVQGYRLTGTKQFITNGGVAQILTILARAPGGPSFFVVERDTPGLSVGPPEKKHGIRASNTTQVILEDVEVPADHLLGLEEGRGLDQANEVFGFTRLLVASFGLGAGEEALRRAVAYGHERIQFGVSLYSKQGFSHKLIVPHAVRLEAARAYCEEVAGRLDDGRGGLQVEGAVAKLFATEAGNAAADAAIQAHGGYGYIHEYEVEKIRRDVRITTIFEGTSEILRRRRSPPTRSLRPCWSATAIGCRASSSCCSSWLGWRRRSRPRWRSPARRRVGRAATTSS
jgi:alkylation response protein AidB-like acyl-CoA dehydrogenase